MLGCVYEREVLHTVVYFENLKDLLLSFFSLAKLGCGGSAKNDVSARLSRVRRLHVFQDWPSLLTCCVYLFMSFYKTVPKSFRSH